MRSLIVFATCVFVCQALKPAPECDPWVSCLDTECKPFPDRCPDGQHLVWDKCGCCQLCSKEPRSGPCGTCGKDLVCKEKNPICKRGQITTLDYCGCCKVCKDVLEFDEKCTPEEPNYGVCKFGLTCIEGRCKILRQLFGNKRH
ncbi:uncharacterized protein LOC143199634 [Rhynchophorus ferrugineus]|uniref:Uncharacterized protein n=1 Tax=Rhynchophorus ferrugineus TaxID=354439 RepID=A0A834IRS0_RHYFE|nr:hypothetical protein GWI33_009549 [Rhynchophorus ferrugineus]